MQKWCIILVISPNLNFLQNNDCWLTSNDFSSIINYYPDGTPVNDQSRENKRLYNDDAIQNRNAFTSTWWLITILTWWTLDLNGYYNLSIIEPNGNLENYWECSVFLDLPDSLHDNFTTENDSRERLYLVWVGVTDFSSPLPYGTKYIFNCHSDNYEVYSHEAVFVIGIHAESYDTLNIHHYSVGKKSHVSIPYMIGNSLPLKDIHQRNYALIIPV